MKKIAVSLVFCFLVGVGSVWAGQGEMKSDDYPDWWVWPPPFISYPQEGYDLVPFDTGEVSGSVITNSRFVWPLTGDPIVKSGVWDLFCAGCNRNLSWSVLLNFEHILSGLAADAVAADGVSLGRSYFSPRQDPCQIFRLGPNYISLFWDADTSQWPIDISMDYYFHESVVDITFSATPVENIPNLGYLAYMCASYISAGADDRALYFLGNKGWFNWGWQAFGVGPKDNFPQGIVPCWGAKSLAYESEANLKPNQQGYAFSPLAPFYYGKCDGDGDLSTAGDKFAFVMMFDRPLQTRFALFNWSGDGNGPAWDWEWVVLNPKVGKTETFKTRVILEPYSSESQLRKDLLKKYLKWRLGL